MTTQPNQVVVGRFTRRKKNDPTLYYTNYLTLAPRKLSKAAMVARLDIPFGQYAPDYEYEYRKDELQIITLSLEDLAEIGMTLESEESHAPPQTVEEWQSLVGEFERIRDEAPQHMGATRNRVAKKLVAMVCEGLTEYDYSENPIRWEMNFMADSNRVHEVSDELMRMALKMTDFVETHKTDPEPNPEVEAAIEATFPGSNWRLPRTESAKIREEINPSPKFYDLCDTPDHPGPTGFVGLDGIPKESPVIHSKYHGVSDYAADEESEEDESNSTPVGGDSF